MAVAGGTERWSEGAGDDAKAEKPPEKSGEGRRAAADGCGEASSGRCSVGFSMANRAAVASPVFSPPLQGSFDAGEEAIAAADCADVEAGGDDAGIKEEGSKLLLIWFDPDRFSSLIAGPNIK